MKLNEVTRIDLTPAGKYCRMWLGDINSDGRMEILMVQPDSHFDDRYYPHSVQAVTAFDLTGKVLWQIGTIDPDAQPSGADIPCQVYDINHDGQLEVICAMDDMLCIFNAKDASLISRHPLPSPDAHDCIMICDLEGTGYPQNIIVKDRYHKAWALDKNFNVMFSHEGNTGHYPWCYDLNHDGHDEVIIGYSVLNYKGETLWTIDMKDHADCIWIGDINSDGDMEVVVGGEDFTAYSSKGELLWRYTDTVESQNVAIGNLRPELEGLEICGLDRIDRSNPGLDGIFLVSSKGECLYKEKRTIPGWSSVCTVINNLDGNHTDHILAYRRGGGMPNAVYDGYLNTIFNFPFDGYIAWGDLTGSGTDQLIVYSNDEAVIYSSKDIDITKTTGIPLPQPKRLYNNTRYWGGEAYHKE